MPTPTYISYPDTNGVAQKSGVVQDASGINYPLVRFDDNVINSLQTGISGTYLNGNIIGSYFNFNLVAGNIGWSGAIAGASLHINNQILATDTLSLLLFSILPAATNIDGTDSGVLTLTDTEADSYIGSLTFANAVLTSGRSLFSTSTLNLKYTTELTLNTLTGILVLNAASQRVLSAARINLKLQITKS